MAENVFKIGIGANYEDGDLLVAFNDKRIQRINSELICFERDPGSRKLLRLNEIGFLAFGDLTEEYVKQHMEYRIERLNRDEAQLVHNTTAAVIRFTTNTTFTDFRGKAVQMDIDQYFSRRATTFRKDDASGVPLFGDHIHQAVIYRGRHDFAQAKIDNVWTQIESKTPHKKTDEAQTLFPFGRQDVRSHLVVTSEDFTDKEMQDLTSPQIKRDGNGDPVWINQDKVELASPTMPDDGNEWEEQVIKKRNVNVDWRTELLGDLAVSEIQVLDKTYPVGREIVVNMTNPHTRSHSKVQTKQPDFDKYGDKTTGQPPVKSLKL